MDDIRGEEIKDVGNDFSHVARARTFIRLKTHDTIRKNEEDSVTLVMDAFTDWDEMRSALERIGIAPEAISFHENLATVTGDQNLRVMVQNNVTTFPLSTQYGAPFTRR